MEGHLQMRSLLRSCAGIIILHVLAQPLAFQLKLRITYLGDKLRLTMICVPSVKANLSLPLICSSHVVKSCLCGGNSIHGLGKTESSTVSRWITFSSTQLQQEGRKSIEDGKYGGWLLQSQFGNSEMTWFFIIRPLLSLSWWIMQFSSLGLG